MDDGQLVRLISTAKQGSRQSREMILRQLDSFALQQARKVCHHPIDRSDDAYSVALLALNETIDAYDPERGASFASFASTVIRRRVIDYLRSEQRHRHLTLAPPEESHSAPAEAKEAALRHQRESDRQFLAAQLEEYKEALLRFDLDIRGLIKATPRRRDARQRLQHAAQVLVKDPELMARLRDTGRLPMTALTQRLPYSRKTLERGRPYIIGTALALSEQFPIIRDHLSGIMKGWEE